MENPLKSIELKTWPDFLLAVSGMAVMISLTALFAGSDHALIATILFAGIFLFGIGGKISYYRYRDSSVKGNMNAWFSGWRHSILSDSLAFIGIALIVLSLVLIYLQNA